MKIKSIANIQAEQIKGLLFSLKKMVSKDDRKAAIIALNISAFTLSRYLNGHIYSIDTAERITTYLTERLTERLQERNKRIQEQKLSLYEC